MSKITFRRCRLESSHFVVIGAMKSGTTTLYQHLSRHPQIGMSKIKETNFFVEQMNWSLGYDWYEQQFDRYSAVTGEVSPAYSKYDIFPGVPERIAGYQPATKLIFIARDPVVRFISHYRHALVMGHTDIKPDDLLASRNGQHMLATSRYALQLEKYLEFFPRNQLHVADFTELTNHPQRAVDKILRFLDVGTMTVQSNIALNDIETIAAIPKPLQKILRTSSLQKLHGLLGQRGKCIVKKILTLRKGTVPSVPPKLQQLAANALREDAQRFRMLAQLDFDHWTV